MRRSLLAFSMLLLATGAPAAAKAPPARVVTNVSGEITFLNVKRVSIGRVTCTLGGRIPHLDRFFVEESVTMTCRNGQVQSLRYLPPPKNITAPGGTSSSTAAHTAQVSSGTFSLSETTGGSSATSPPGTTLSARGALTALSPDGVTVGDVTCPIGATTSRILADRVNVGDTVSMSCTQREGGPNTFMLVVSAKPSSAG
jgi:hypothetical protein